MGATAKSVDGIHENHRHGELLAWATTRIDQLTSGDCARQRVSELLDWMAYFTREHFGFQERVLAECSRQRDYLARRTAIHLEFRRELARLCVDCTRGDPTVPERLSFLCHRLLEDAQAERDAFSEQMRAAGKPARLRADRRRHPLSDEALENLEARAAH